MSSAPDLAFSDVSLALQADPDADVTATASTLLVHGRVFAALVGDSLVVDLPEARAADLIHRGMASAAPAVTSPAAGVRVSVDDVENWLELATEAHQFVGEPPVGRQS
jgi:hypothetical protein